MSTRRHKAFWRNENGATAALYALALPALVAVGGVGFDYARLAGMDSELQNAADQAALAGATQLDGKGAVGTAPGACQRAINAAASLITNRTLLGLNDLAGNTSPNVAMPAAEVVFYDSRADAEAGTDDFSATDTNCDTRARFIHIKTAERTAKYALTPVAGAFFGKIVAEGVAGLGSSVCKVPPLMICSPDPSQPFNAAAKKGWGVQATGLNNGKPAPGSSNEGQTRNTWSPGNFGFLQVEDPTQSAQNRNEALLKAIAFVNPPLDCTPVGDNKVSTGNPQRLYDALNTRFDIYDMPSGGGNVLAPCHSGSCPAAPNVVKDLRLNGTTSKGLSNGSNPGWKVEGTNTYWPLYSPGWNTASSFQDPARTIAIMGLPRDNCHYESYTAGAPTTECPSGSRFGNGVWGRDDYFRTYHSGDYPAGWQSITRYETYLWEINNGKIPAQTVTSGDRGWGTPAPTVRGTPDVNRRVLTVAVVSNCAALSGSSTNVVIDEWIDVFLVEPTVDSRPNNAAKDSIYVEVIGPSSIAGSGTYASQQIRRDVPYLVR